MLKAAPWSIQSASTRANAGHFLTANETVRVLGLQKSPLLRYLQHAFRLVSHRIFELLSQKNTYCTEVGPREQTHLVEVTYVIRKWYSIPGVRMQVFYMLSKIA